VKVEPRDFVRWFRARQVRDMISSHNKPEEGKPLPELEDKPLLKALEVLGQDLASAAKPEAKPPG
jgi:hypothetical protein